MKKFRKTLVLLIVFAVILSTCITSFAYDMPQSYSSDTVGDVPEVVIPEETVQDGILVYLNTQQIELANKPFVDNDVLYLPAELYLMLGFNIEIGDEIVVINNGASTGKDTDVTAEIKTGSKKVTVNGTNEVELSGDIITKKNVTYLSADILSAISNEKVWYDSFSETLVITTGEYKNDGILRIINYKFWMNGEPYYEISFNKFDLCYQISSSFATNGAWPSEEYQIPAAEAALSQLHELGFQSIRIFMSSNIRQAWVRSQKQKDKYMQVMDKVFELCEKYEIKVVYCLDLPSSDFCPKGEDKYDLICNADSQSRANLYEFIDLFIQRYKDSPSVLMWEIVNEGNLDCDVGWSVGDDRFSLYQLGQFYTDCAKRIKQNDSEHLVTGGDSCFRTAQWHLYLGTKSGLQGNDWTKDTLEDRLKAYVMLYSGLDVVSIHTYSTGLSDTTFKTSDTDSTEVAEDFELYVKEARRIGKPVYNGETAVNADTYDENVYQQSLTYIQSIIDSGIQINHWWTFRSDRQGNFNDGYGWDISYGELLDAIVAGNKKIKETYVINGVNEYSDIYSSDAKVITGQIETTQGTISGHVENTKSESGCGAVISSITVFTTVMAAAFVLTKKR